jgi:type III restriction enzyme
MLFDTETSQPVGAHQLVGNDDGPLQRNLFAPMYEDDFNSEERDVAVYLDGDAALSWWHRNVARSQYAVQGWRKAKIYPDFIFAVGRKDGSSPHYGSRNQGRSAREPRYRL